MDGNETLEQKLKAFSEGKSVKYTVQPGDYLAKIARIFYGSIDDWPKIYKANRYTEGVDSPDMIQSDTVLTIYPADKAPK